MNRKEAKEFLPIMQAYIEGRDIEVNIGTLEKPNWKEVKDADLLFHSRYYRIKPEVKLVPFTLEDNLLGKVVRTKGTSNKSLIIGLMKSGVYCGTKTMETKYSEFIIQYEFEDGSPCGKIVED